MLSLRSNGFIAYVPAFDAKGPVYISDKEGQVQVLYVLCCTPSSSKTEIDVGFSNIFLLLPKRMVSSDQSLLWMLTNTSSLSPKDQRMTHVVDRVIQNACRSEMGGGSSMARVGRFVLKHWNKRRPEC